MIRYWHWLVAQQNKEPFDPTIYYVRCTLTDNSDNFDDAKIGVTFTDNSVDLIAEIVNNSIEFSYTGKYLKSLRSAFSNIQGIKGQLSSDALKTKIQTVEFTEKLENVTDVSFLFTYCSALTSVNFNDATLDKINSTESMFEDCTSLASISASGASNIKLDNLLTTKKMFASCSSITTINSFSNASFKKCANASYMFASCTGLSSLNLSSATFEECTDASYMFYRLIAIKNLTLKHNSSVFCNLLNASHMFNIVRCTTANLAKFDLSGITFDKVTNASNMFQSLDLKTDSNYTSSFKLDLSDATFDKVTSADYMFNEACASELDLSSATFNSVTNAQYMFNSFHSLNSGSYAISPVDLSNATFKDVTNASYMFYGSYMNIIQNSFSFTALQIGSYMFTSSHISINSQSNELDLAGITFSNVTNASHMFGAEEAKYEKIGSNWVVMNSGPVYSDRIILSAATFENVTNTSYMFAGAKGVLDLSSAKFKKVTNANKMFACYQGTTINLSNSDSTFENLTTATSMFDGCTALTTLIVPHTGKFPISLNLGHCPLSETSIEHISYWLKDMSGSTQQTLTLNQNAWNAVQGKTAIQTRLTNKNWDLQLFSF